MKNATLTKTQSAQPLGTYKPTAIDSQKAAADFTLTQVGPFVIKWANGNSETVTASKLAKLQEKYNWATNF